MGEVGHAMLENYDKLKIDHAEAQARIAELEKRNTELEKRNAELESAAGKDKPEPPPK